ncbi:hypothetical protein Hanom_Chr03g00202521 [Helianthus anomalus]
MNDKWPENSENVPVLLLDDEGARIPNPRPCRAITPVGKEVVYLSSEESVALYEHELNPPYDMFSNVLRNLGIDPDEKIPKRVSKKKVTVSGGTTVKETEIASLKLDAASRKGTAQFRQGSLEDFIYVADSFEELYAIGEKAQGSAWHAELGKRGLCGSGIRNNPYLYPC